MTASENITFRDARQEVTDKDHALIVVAHWDDEIISAWGAMLTYRSDVLCVTDKPMAGYRDVFEELVRDCGCCPLNWLIPNREPSGRFTRLHTPRNVERLVALLANEKYDRVMTHHFSGDIASHSQHIMLSNLCYDAISASGCWDETALYCFLSQPHPTLWPTWFPGSSVCVEKINITKEPNEKRLEYARKYTSDFEKHYPAILSSCEEHQQITLRGTAWRWMLNLNYASVPIIRRLSSRVYHELWPKGHRK